MEFVKIVCDNYWSDYNYPQWNGLALDGMNAVISTTYLYTDFDSITNPGSYACYVKIAIVDDGFYVFYCGTNSHAKTNYNNYKFHYIVGR